MFKKSYPDALTSYDFLKIVAVLLMLVDHMGYYFFPDVVVLRIVGRFCVPIWFFLAGYAKTRAFRLDWAIGGLILVAASLVTQGYVFPVNILGSMLIIRLVIDGVAFVAFKDLKSVVYTAFLGAVLYIPSHHVFEYGTLGVLLALLGYRARHLDNNDRDEMVRHLIFFLSVFIVFFCFQRQITDMALYEEIFLAAGSFMMMLCLQFFRPVCFVSLTERMPRPLVFFLQLMGRRTMEFYVIHVLLFKALAMSFEMPGFGWHEWSWFY